MSVTLYRGMRGMKACVRLVRQHIALSLSAQPLPCAAQVQDNFLQQGRGGTELAPMSTTRSLKVAMQYAASEAPSLRYPAPLPPPISYGRSSHAHPTRAQNSLLLRIDTKNFMVRGPAISFLSAFPAEEEYLFPPLTYLEPTPEGVQTLRVDDATFTVIDVQPAQ